MKVNPAKYTFSKYLSCITILTIKYSPFFLEVTIYSLRRSMLLYSNWVAAAKHDVRGESLNYKLSGLGHLHSLLRVHYQISVMASLIFLGRVRGVRSIFSCKETFLAPVRIAASGRRCMSQEKPISRFPVPIRDTLPQDIQQRMSEVEEKVPLIEWLWWWYLLISLYCEDINQEIFFQTLNDD